MKKLRFLGVAVLAFAALPAWSEAVECGGWKALFAQPGASFSVAPADRVWLVGDVHDTPEYVRGAAAVAERVKQAKGSQKKGCLFVELSRSYQNELNQLGAGKLNYSELWARIAEREWKRSYQEFLAAIERDPLESVKSQLRTHWWQTAARAGWDLVATDHPKSPQFKMDTTQSMQLRNAHIAQEIAESLKSGRCDYGVGFYGMDHLTESSARDEYKTIGGNLASHRQVSRQVLIVPTSNDKALQDLIPPHCMGPWGSVPEEYRVKSSRFISREQTSRFPKMPMFWADVERLGDIESDASSFDWVYLQGK